MKINYPLLALAIGAFVSFCYFHFFVITVMLSPL